MSADPIWLAEADVVELVDLVAAVAAVRSALVLEHRGQAQTMPKTSVVWGDGHTLHAIGGVADGVGLVGVKTWAHTAGGASPLLVLWDAATGALRAVVEAFALGQLRTAAVSAVATDHLAAPDADVLAVIGSGRQAFAQVAAVAAVRPLKAVAVHSPTATHRASFVDRLRSVDAAPEVLDCASVAEAVDGAAIVTTVTRAREPILHADMLAANTHINAMGAISLERRELAADVAAGASCVVADSPDTARRLSHELEEAAEIVALSALVSGRARPNGRSVFKSMGIGLADVAVGAEVLSRAAQARAGRAFPAPVKVQPHLFGGRR